MFFVLDRSDRTVVATQQLPAVPCQQSHHLLAAPTAGDPNRLIFALDSQGMLCGVNNTYRNETIDLTTRPNLYYLNALDLLNPVNMLYAKSVCVADCPGEDSVCGTGSMPCTNDTQYRCVCMSPGDSLYVWSGAGS